MNAGVGLLDRGSTMASFDRLCGGPPWAPLEDAFNVLGCSESVLNSRSLMKPERSFCSLSSRLISWVLTMCCRKAVSIALSEYAFLFLGSVRSFCRCTNCTKGKAHKVDEGSETGSSSKARRSLPDHRRSSAGHSA